MQNQAKPKPSKAGDQMQPIARAGAAYCPGRCRSYYPDKNVPSRCGPIARTLMRPSCGANSIARPLMRICLGGAKLIGWYSQELEVI